MCAHR